MINVIVDAFGGDNAPDAVIEGNQGESFDEGEDVAMAATEGNDAPAEDSEEVAAAEEE